MNRPERQRRVMCYRIEKDEEIPVAIRRIARDEIDSISSHLSRSPLRAKNIHEARRHLKKLRGLLRLMRGSLPVKFYDREKNSFRDLAQQLAPARDSRVVAKTLTALHEKDKDGRAKIFREMTKRLQQEESRRTEQIAGKTFAPLMSAARKRVEAWPIEDLTWKDLRDGLKESYHRAANGLKKAAKQQTSEAFHEWRKRVKALTQHLDLLQTKWKRSTRRMLKKLEALDDYLGEDHDWAMLSETLARGGRGVNQKWIQKIMQRSLKHRRRFQKRALKSGDKLFAAKPGRFVQQQTCL